MNLERINLVPQQPFAERIRHIIPLILLLVVSLIIVLVYLENNLISTKLAKVDREITRINNASDDAAQLIAVRQKLSVEVGRLQKEFNELSERTDKLGRMNAKKIALSQALLRIAAALPPTVICNTISFQGVSGKIQGTALNYNDAPQMVRKMNKDPLFNNVILQNIDQQKDADRQRLKFNILFTLNMDS